MWDWFFLIFIFLNMITKIICVLIQVEMNPAWQQHKLKEYCTKKGITITAYSPLGGQINFIPNLVLTSDVLKEIADAKGKSIAQVRGALFTIYIYTRFIFHIDQALCWY